MLESVYKIIKQVGTSYFCNLRDKTFVLCLVVMIISTIHVHEINGNKL